mgnify:CR=1 FL=1
MERMLALVVPRSLRERYAVGRAVEVTTRAVTGEREHITGVVVVLRPGSRVSLIADVQVTSAERVFGREWVAV